MKAFPVASGYFGLHLKSMLYVLQWGGRVGMSRWIQAHSPPHNITEHQTCRLAGLRHFPWAHVEPHGSEASQLDGEIMPRKTSENVNC